MAKIFIISPVRAAKQEILDYLAEYVSKLEEEGHTVHFHVRDVDQTDDGLGLNIITAHRRAMRDADEVHIWWDDDSRGSLFDFGTAWAFSVDKPKKFVAINRDEIKSTPGKSYTNILLKLSE